MALQCKKINDKYMQIDLYYRIEGIDFTANNCIIIYLVGYSLDEDRVVLDNDVCFTFKKRKDEEVSYELAYNLLKTKEEFKDAIDC